MRDIMGRIGRLLPVAEQAAGQAGHLRAAQAAGEDSRDQVRRVWTQAAADGLLPVRTDVDWLADIAGILSAADTYLHVSRTLWWTAGTSTSGGC